ncbi:MAG: formylglycine-generating enzyme family protein, partial [Thermoguttaceae bacterium]|nr:formylglycine-generating enzyme family protein [Thermoguttaceae bacterium]
MQMKDFMKSTLVFAAVFVLLETAGCDSGFQVVQKPSDDEAWALHEKDLFSPGEAGERMEIEIEGVMTAFRWAPPGSFTRRWNKSTECEWEKETEWDDDEKDYKVTLTQGFWLAETETTQALWKAVMENNPSLGGRVRKAPVNNVSWEDAQEFISKLNGGGYAPAGFEFCLPTEAQWEYACMAGSADDRCGELDAIAWYGDNSEKHAHEVGQKEANAWGFYDMLGNVCEWCGDWYGKYPMDDLTDYAGPQSGSNRVIRGGGWTGDAESCRRFYRLTDWDGWDGVSDSNLGFRLCLVPMAVGPSALSEEDLASPARAGARVAVEIMGVNTAFRWAPPGSFTRHWDLTTGGDWERKTDPDDDRKDFEITLTQGFWLAETETTQELWQSVTGENPSVGQRTRKMPVNNVYRKDTQKFISQLN